MSVAVLERVTKRFGPVAALDDVSFELSSGDVLAVLGPNGAGKSTALAILLGLRRADAGRARLFGLDPRRPSARQLVGVALQETGFPVTLRVRELIEIVRAHYMFAHTTAEVIGRFGLESLARRQVGGLSGGERRRVAVALAFTGRPTLVVLDEPTAGLDGEARHAIWGAVRSQVEDGGTVLLTTHHLDEAEALATRVVLIDHGTVMMDGTVESIKASAGLARVTFRAPPGLAVEGAERIGAQMRMLTPDAGALVERLVHAHIPLDELEVRPVTLEEAIAQRRRVGHR